MDSIQTASGIARDVDVAELICRGGVADVIRGRAQLPGPLERPHRIPFRKECVGSASVRSPKISSGTARHVDVAQPICRDAVAVICGARSYLPKVWHRSSGAGPCEIAGRIKL